MQNIAKERELRESRDALLSQREAMNREEFLAHWQKLIQQQADYLRGIG